MGLIPADIFRSILDSTPAAGSRSGRLWPRLKMLFRSVDQGNPDLNINRFNGGLFAEDQDLDELKIGDDILTRLMRLAEYDFASELNVNILGHIFEQSISDIEELKAEIRNQDYDVKSGKRKRDGVFYTPEYITRYMVREAVGGWLAERREELGFAALPALTDEDYHAIREKKPLNGRISRHIEFWEAYREALAGIKVLDPACGSGAFLNQVYDYLKAEGERVQHELTQLLPERQNDLNLDEQILRNNIFGVDLNPESVEITRLSLWLKTADKHKELTVLDDNIRCGNSLVSDPDLAGEEAFDWKAQFPEILRTGGFDVIVGNPPYGARLSKAEQDYFQKTYRIGSSDTAILFLKRSWKLLREDGWLCFIIPKSFAFAGNYRSIREMLWDYIATLVDCGKVWKEVKLEQVILALHKGRQSAVYRSALRIDQTIEPLAEIAKSDARQFGFLLNGVTAVEVAIANKVRAGAVMLNDLVHNRRGAMLQREVQPQGELTAIGGAEVQRFGLRGEKGRLEKNTVLPPQALLQENSLLVQNIVAHILYPVDHIQITACLPERRQIVLLDTVNQLTIRGNDTPEYLWALLNSRLINWYVYCFIYGKPVRTMHFDNAVTARIPVKPLARAQQQPFVEMAGEIRQAHQQYLAAREAFVEVMKSSLGRPEVGKRLAVWPDLDEAGFLKALRKHGGVADGPEQEAWLARFNTRRPAALALKARVEALSDRLDLLIYRLYGLNYAEVREIDYDMRLSPGDFD
ncbi:MAG: N-6 DNA methylase [Calditrichaeota bacterium]|nr:N-6 DNA methylase [Calditrichota bacterium]MCB0304544.1 N-6 DNA methylase [Calditrichota bacterium]